MMKCIAKEISLRNDFFEKETPIHSIYFGGGTPSILEPSSIQSVIQLIQDTFDVVPYPEITLEANPDDLTKAYLQSLKSQTVVNRLSIGVQSFFEEDLHYMRRAHTALQAHQAIQDALDSGFTNLTVDLIYGVPTLSDEHWIENIQILMRFGIPHISAYALTVEEKTILYQHIRQQKTKAPDDDKTVRHYKMLIETLENAGFTHYEISNFAKENFEAVHNSIYWNNAPYLGIGPSAHSYNGDHRLWNIANNAQYIAAIHADLLPLEKELLTTNDRFNEYLMTKLRTSKGIDTKDLKNRFDETLNRYFLQNIEPFVQQELVIQQAGKYTLTVEGKLFSDRIIAELFIV